MGGQMLRQNKTSHTTFSQGFHSALKRLDADAANHLPPAAAGVSGCASGQPSFSKELTAGSGQSGPSGAAKGAEKAPLGIDTKSVEAQKSRKTRFRHQRGAAKILNYQHRVGLCQWAPIDAAKGVFVSIRGTEIGAKAGLSGVQRCGSVWACPCCSAAISHVRKGELNAALSWGREHGFLPLMLTLTARHGSHDDLKDLRDRMKRAKQLFHGRNGWVKLKPLLAGHITATETTQGRNGWHPHFHVLLFVKPKEMRAYLRKQGVETHGKKSEPLAVSLFDTLLPWWLEALADCGLDGNGAALQVQGAANAGDYIAKWGAGEEMTLSGAKRARGKGRTPAQLLADAVDGGDDEAAELWAEFVHVFHGSRQLTWSRGLKKAVGLQEISDAEAAEDAEDAVLNVPIYGSQWSDGKGVLGARHRRGRILTAAEKAVNEAAKTPKTNEELQKAAAVAVLKVVSDGGDEDGPSNEALMRDISRIESVIDDDDPDCWDFIPNRSVSSLQLEETKGENPS